MLKLLHDRVRNPKERRQLAIEMFLEELGETITDQDFIAGWSIDSIDDFLDILNYDPDPYWLNAIRQTVKEEVMEYRTMYKKFTSGHFEGNDNVPVSFDELT
ncbi:hypothetical protein BFP97_17875 [Roseivirga sp. 4D4]|uniref:hypothetical protein n=1 Tax=Roseivirga sp. 4D4 TaxID=1889784 RepID=UPI000853D0FA|nr:hypothetical protein [Roseivirga sp. 4D4]OEK03279.1 hypothetical protein BFP97_17875 [Roseivirga sp. 4D4]